ncbi:toll-like receptor 13 [Thunnus maccoyii]|uniref:toll-like receptor 13 n=1 Tax=Thunnus maccoyii TaxID=8240 RepID=UPI001C4BC312|nr:toll-like receptor 13 [Thunnus maccoyii]
MGTIRRRLLLLLSLLLHLNPSLTYSLKSCNIDYSEDSSADVVLDCSNGELVVIPDDIPGDVSSVNLRNNTIGRINREDFGFLSKLRLLSLDLNEIADIDDGSFIGLVALTKLRMRFNNLTNLTSNLFQGLSNLTTLDVGNNNIQFIDTSAFQFLTSLQTVKLDSNQLRQVSDIQPILQLPHLRELIIGDNQFHSFQTKDLLLNMSSSLQMLDVAHNELEKFSITTPIFPRLELVDISRCGHNASLEWDIPDKTLLRNITQLYFSYSSLPFKEMQNVLQSLDSLMHLRLNHMREYINKGLLKTVCKIPTLKKLDLSYNQCPNISAKLVSCSQLTELDLSITYMTELSQGSIRSMKQLKNLVVQGNFLSKVPDDISGLSSLEILDLSNNLLTELVCGDFLNTTRLTELYLNTNHIAKLDGCVFENMNDLKVLDLSENLLWTFGSAFKMGLQRLEFLHLSKNSLSILEEGDFKGLRSVKYLDMVSDNIKWVRHKALEGLNNLETLIVLLPLTFEINFTGMQQLENLTIYFNTDIGFKKPPPNLYEAFPNLKSLKMLTIICKGDHFGYPFDIPSYILKAMDRLEEFTAVNLYVSAPHPKTFQFNSQLKNLTIEQTDLSDLDPELFRPIPNLKSLDLSKNKLRSLDFLAQVDLPALSWLKLRENELMVINETVFQSLPALTYLDLLGNPFACNCSNIGFIQWVKSNNQTQVVNAYQYACSFPVAKRGSKLLDFDIQSCWIDVNFFCFISSTCLVVLTLLTSFIYHFLRWQLVYSFYLFLAFLYDSRRRKKESPHCYDAFISYNVHDEAWVYREMLQVLEGEQGWRLCLHHRDFQPGKPIIENITDAIYSSRKTICVISQRYLQSEWCSREIQMASFRLFDEQKDVLILLFLEEIPAYQLSPFYRMRKLVKRHTYLSWSQAGQHTGVFWQNVRRALETRDAPTENTNLLTGPAGSFHQPAAPMSSG